MDIFNEIDTIQSHFEKPINVSTYIGERNRSYEYNFNTQQEIALITFMSASKYISGNTDALGVKPFYNIVNQIVDLEVRATDTDTKNIILRPTSPEFEVHALLATKGMHHWFDEYNFAELINRFGEIGARYGNALFKRSYNENGDLNIEIVNWLSIAFDQFDIEKGAKVETHFMTALDLEKKRGVWDDEAINEAVKEIAESSIDSDGDEKNTRDIEVLELEAELPRSVFTGDKETKGFSLQHYFVIKEAKRSNGIILFSEELKESNYIYYGRKKLDGRGWALGVVEQGKEAQGEVNLLKVAERRALELAGKKFYKTNDPELDNNNIFTDKENGDVIYVDGNKDLTELSTFNNAIPQFENAKQSWEQQFKSSLSAFDAVTGDNLPSGTAYRLGLLQAKQANSIFKYIQQGKGLVLKKVITKWVLPEVYKKIDRDFILEAGFSPKELDMIQERFATSIANEKLAEILRGGELPDPITYEEMISDVKANLPKKGVQFLEVKKGMFKDAWKHIRVDITGESEEVDAKIETLNSLLTIAQQDQQGVIFSNEDKKELVKEITRLANLSTIEYGIGGKSKQAQEQNAVVSPIKTPTNEPADTKLLQ